MSKRSNGEGNVSRRGNRYYGRLQIGVSDDGKPIIKRFSGGSESDVKRQMKAYSKSKETRKANEFSSFQEYADNWLVTFKKPNLKPKSYDRLETTLKYQVYPYIGNIVLGEVTDEDVQKMLNMIKESGLSYSVSKKAYDATRAVFNYAAAKRAIYINPFVTVIPPSQALFESSERQHYFTKYEASRITEEARRVYSTGKSVYPYGGAYILMLNTGLRCGEVIALRKEDYNRNNKTLTINRTAEYAERRDENGNRIGGRELIYGTPKTYSGRRTIPLNSTAIEVIEKMISDHPLSDLIVCNTLGNPIIPEKITRSFYRILDNIGLPRCGVHSLRHTFASILFANGYDVSVVSKILGHASVSITMNTYIHMLENLDRDAVSSLDELF